MTRVTHPSRRRGVLVAAVLALSSVAGVDALPNATDARQLPRFSVQMSGFRPDRVPQMCRYLALLVRSPNVREIVLLWGNANVAPPDLARTRYLGSAILNTLPLRCARGWERAAERIDELGHSGGADPGGTAPALR